MQKRYNRKKMYCLFEIRNIPLAPNSRFSAQFNARFKQFDPFFVQLRLKKTCFSFYPAFEEMFERF